MREDIVHLIAEFIALAKTLGVDDPTDRTQALRGFFGNPATTKHDLENNILTELNVTEVIEIGKQHEALAAYFSNQEIKANLVQHNLDLASLNKFFCQRAIYCYHIAERKINSQAEASATDQNVLWHKQYNKFIFRISNWEKLRYFIWRRLALDLDNNDIFVCDLINNTINQLIEIDCLENITNGDKRLMLFNLITGLINKLLANNNYDCGIIAYYYIEILDECFLVRFDPLLRQRINETDSSYPIGRVRYSEKHIPRLKLLVKYALNISLQLDAKHNTPALIDYIDPEKSIDVELLIGQDQTIHSKFRDLQLKAQSFLNTENNHKRQRAMNIARFLYNCCGKSKDQLLQHLEQYDTRYYDFNEHRDSIALGKTKVIREISNIRTEINKT